MNITLENGVCLELNDKNQTAKVISSLLAHDSILIPKSFNYQSVDYTIIKVDEDAFNSNQKIKSIKFDNESKLVSIGKKAFYQSSLESIEIPSKVEQIGEESFSLCESLKVVIFQTCSNLQTISKDLFSFSSIESIVIPPAVTRISENSFRNCNKLKSITIPNDSSLQSIGQSAFCYTKFTEIYLPSKVEILEEGWCSNITELADLNISPMNQNFSIIEGDFIVGKTDKNSHNFDYLIFARRDIIEASIPSNIKKIGSFCFDGCEKLRTITFSEDSELLTIERYAFYNTSFEEIQIPSHVNKIGEFVFFDCHNLKSVHFTENSELRTIEKGAFLRTSIENLSFNSKVQVLHNGWCCSTPNLINIDISKSNKFFDKIEGNLIVAMTDESCQIFDSLIFAPRNITEVTIPATIRTICSYCFDECCQLRTIKFSENSELEKIDSFAFFQSLIGRIEIPSRVHSVEYRAFAYCSFLRSVTFLSDPKISNSNFLMINNEAFDNCDELNSIEFLGEKYQIGSYVFNRCLKTFLASFPNCDKLVIKSSSFFDMSADFSLFISNGCELIINKDSYF